MDLEVCVGFKPKGTMLFAALEALQFSVEDIDKLLILPGVEKLIVLFAVNHHSFLHTDTELSAKCLAYSIHPCC